MIKCIAVYPHTINDEYKKKVSKTISNAKKYHFDEVFTTVHLPEYSFEQQVECLKIISKEAKKHNLEVTVDVGGHYVSKIIDNPDLIKGIKLDFIRLDYGYKLDQVKALYKLIKLKGFVINASIYNKEEFKKQIKDFKKINKNIEIRACHNFYIKDNSGIGPLLAERQDSYLREYNLPIYYCVPTYSNPRGPLHKGLCTIENHRYQGIRDILVDLYIKHDLNAFMMADEWLSDEEFKEVDKTLNLLTRKLKKKETIKVKLLDNITEKERKIVLQDHFFRFDSTDTLLRSQSSRQMAEFASVIEKHNNVLRLKGSLGIDNKLNKRYSGEFQVITQELKKDPSINVVGILANEDDLITLLRFREGITYKFVEVK